MISQWSQIHHSATGSGIRARSWEQCGEPLYLVIEIQRKRADLMLAPGVWRQWRC